MPEAGNRQTLDFQAEVKQLLRLMIHSLYSNRDIFLRELISNASDACDKLRFEAIRAPELLAEDADLAIQVSAEPEAGVIRVSDNGIGMSREEVVENLGTIASSGTSRFLEALNDKDREGSSLIGQFGVGFYSAFLVAERVEVNSRRAGLPADDGVRWSSDGTGSYVVESVPRETRGTEVVLHLKEDAREYVQPDRLRALLRHYSDHIAFPVRMPTAEEGEKETVNSATALWLRRSNEVNEDEYREFFRHVAHESDAPLAWAHNHVEGTREYISLLFVPGKAPFDLWNRERSRGLKLYVQRVFVMDDAEQFLPLYLRFIRGVVDCADLPLNVSRELLQQDARVSAMRKALTRRALDMLAELAQSRPDDYARFWREFGSVLKEGLVEDPLNSERIAALLRFESLAGDEYREMVTLDDYISRMPEEQEDIYVLHGESLAAARSSPHLEGFRKKGTEVLLMHERIDEWVIPSLERYRDHGLVDIARGALPPGEEGAKGLDEMRAEAHRGILEGLKSALGDEVEEVRASRRLTESPSCLVLAESDVSMQMRRMLAAAGHELPRSRPVLEVNPQHPLVRRLEGLSGEDFDDLARLLLDEALIAQGERPADPGAFLRRLNRLLEIAGEAHGG